MKQNRNLSQKISIEISDAVCTEEKIWFVANNFNSLFCMDIKSRKIKFIGTFPNEPYGQEGLFSSMILADKKVYFIPYFAKSVAVYDIEKNEFDNIELDLKLIKFGIQKSLFIGAEKYKNYLFLFPSFSNVIIRLNLNNYNMDYITEWTKQIEEDIIFEKTLYFSRQVILREDSLFVPFVNANAVLELNCKTLQSIIHKLGNEKKGYSGICDDGEKFWLSTRSFGGVISWDLKTNEINTICSHDELSKENSHNCLGIVCYDNKMHVFPAQNEVSLINEKQERIVFIQGEYIFVKDQDGFLIYYESETSTLTVINKMTGNRFVTEVAIDKNTINVKRLYDEEIIIKENKELSLNIVLTGLKQGFIFSSKSEEKNNNNGKRIFLELFKRG